MIYAMSDIHGCIENLKKQMEQVDLSEKNRIVFLGDYIDYGNSSYQVLKYIWDLQKKYGAEKVVVLKGNHNGISGVRIYDAGAYPQFCNHLRICIFSGCDQNFFKLFLRIGQSDTGAKRDSDISYKHTENAFLSRRKETDGRNDCD